MAHSSLLAGLAVSVLLGSGPAFAASAAAPAPSAAPAAMKPFIDGLLRRMTIEEKAGQLSQHGAGWTVTGPEMSVQLEKAIAEGRVGSLLNVYTPNGTRTFQEMAVNRSRLKIPLLFGFDVIHGHRTIFPIPLGEAASWDLPLIEKSARLAATEAAADGLHWTFAPMVDIARDPRWGRVMEGSGEDPWLGSRIAEARVRGFKGRGVGSLDTVLSCVKHFAGYGAPLAGRDYHSVDMSLRELAEVYLPPYEAAVRAGADTVMSSFNDIAGVPSSSNRWLLTDVLRGAWSFKGFVVSDWTSVAELQKHGTSADGKAAARDAFHAGLDMDMSSDLYANHLPRLVREGKVPLADLNRSVRRILEAKYRLGLFQDPYRFSDERRARETMLSAPMLAHARDIGRRSIVLMKNNGFTLPLKKDAKIALVGPFGEDKVNQLGSWSGAGSADPVVTLREGMSRLVGDDARIVSVKGANFLEDAKLLEHLRKNGRNVEMDPLPREELLRQAVEAAQGADVIVAALGEPRDLTGEAASRTRIRLPESQTALLRALRALKKPLVLVLFNGRPLALEDEEPLADAIVEAWFLGTRAGEAIADVLYGDYNPSGKLTMTFPVNEGQIPIFYAERNTGRPMNPADPGDWWKSRYLDAPNEPLFPFGWGLSYTRFTYGMPKLDRATLLPGGALHLTVDVTNAGPVAGEEVVQLYVRDLVASISQPVKVLKGFRKLLLAPGETKTVTFTLREKDLRFFGPDNKWISEAGTFKAFVGGNSVELKEVSFEVKK